MYLLPKYDLCEFKCENKNQEKHDKQRLFVIAIKLLENVFISKMITFWLNWSVFFSHFLSIKTINIFWTQINDFKRKIHTIRCSFYLNSDYIRLPNKRLTATISINLWYFNSMQFFVLNDILINVLKQKVSFSRNW